MGGVEHLAGQLDKVLEKDDFGHKLNRGTGEEEHAATLSSLTVLNKLLRNVDGLPMAVTDVLGVDPINRHSQVGFTILPEVRAVQT